MENILKQSSKKLITDCRFFEKEWSITFVIEYVTWKTTWKTFVWKDWQDHNELKKSFENLFITRSDLPQIYDKKSDDEICQDLKWKSLVSAYILTA